MTSSSSCYNDFRMILYTLTDTPESPCLMLFYWVVGRFVFNICNTHRIHVWNIYLHFIYHKNQLFMLVIIPVPWILWYRAISEIRRKGCVKKLRWKFCHDLANVFDTLLVWAGIVAWAEKPGGFWKFFGKQHIGGSVLTVHHKIYISHQVQARDKTSFFPIFEKFLCWLGQLGLSEFCFWHRLLLSTLDTQLGAPLWHLPREVILWLVVSKDSSIVQNTFPICIR